MGPKSASSSYKILYQQRRRNSACVGTHFLLKTVASVGSITFGIVGVGSPSDRSPSGTGFEAGRIADWIGFVVGLSINRTVFLATVGADDDPDAAERDRVTAAAAAAVQSSASQVSLIQ